MSISPRSLRRSSRPHLTIFSSTRPYANQNSHNISQFSVQNAKFLVTYPKNRSKPSSGSFNLGKKKISFQSSILSKKSVQQAFKGADPFPVFGLNPYPTQSWGIIRRGVLIYLAERGCRSNGSLFYKKSLKMGPVFYPKILKHGSSFLTEPQITDFRGFRMAKTPKIAKFFKNRAISEGKSLKMGTLFGLNHP